MKKQLTTLLLICCFIVKGQVKDNGSFATKNYCSTNSVQPFNVGYARSSTMQVLQDTITIISFDDGRDVVRKYHVDISYQEDDNGSVKWYICGKDIAIRINPYGKWAMVIDNSNRSGFTMLFHNYDNCKK